MIYVFWTCANPEEAKKIARGLLERRWFACASILPAVESVYRWEGNVEESKEAKVILKTKRELFADIRDYILKHGSYQVPEISAVKVEIANPSYLKWLEEEVGLPG